MKFTIKLKLALAFAVLILLLVGTAGFGMRSLSSINDTMEATITGPVQRLELVQRINIAQLQGIRQQDGARLVVMHPRRAVELRFKEQFLPAPNYNAPSSEVSAPAVFVGFGVHAPELQHDDFAALDVRGKVAVLFNGAPARFDHDRRAFYSSSRE